MRYTLKIAFLIFIALLLTACGDPKLDGSSDEAMKKSIDDLLEQIYESNNLETQLAAIEALSKKGGDKTIGVFIELLKKDNDVKKTPYERSTVLSERIVDGFQLIGSPAVDPLISELKRGYASYTFPYTLRIAEALGKIGDKKAIEPIVRATKVYVFVNEYAKDITIFSDSTLGYLNSLKYFGGKAVKPLIRLLGDQDVAVRAMAAEALGIIGNDKAIKSLKRLLKDEYPAVRTIAAKAMVEIIGEKNAGNMLINFLGVEDNGVRTFAAEVLGLIGDKNAVEPLINLLENSDSQVKATTAKALGNIGDPKAVDPLIKLLEGEDDNYVRTNAAEALGIFGDKKAVEALISSLKDREGPFINKAVAKALGTIGDKRAVDPLISILPSSPNWGTIITVLGKIGDPKAVVPILRIAGSSMDTGNICGSRVSKSVVDALVQIGEVGVPQCLPYLKDDNYKIRAVVIETIGEIGVPNVEDPILNALDDDHHHVRKLAARSAGRIRLSKAESKLTNLMQDPNIQVQIWAAYALYRLGHGESVNFLIDKLNEPDLITLSDAACALGEAGDARSISGLVSLWEKSLEMVEKEDNRRKQKDQSLIGYQFSNFGNFTPGALEDVLVYSLENIGNPVINYIIPKLKDNRKYVRKNAVSFLDKIGWKPENKADKISYIVAKEDFTDCWSLGKIDTQYLIPYLAEDYRDVRNWIPSCLGKIGEKSVSNNLVPLLTDWYYRKDIVSSLSALEWQPSNDKEQIHFWVAKGEGSELRNSWEITKKVLLEDIEANDYLTIENALYAFIGIGKEEIIQKLLDILNSKGNKIMAEAYLNCGYTELKLAAKEWARRNGYQIVAGEGASPVAWGGM
jgi:HEAT repeat protein